MAVTATVAGSADCQSFVVVVVVVDAAAAVETAFVVVAAAAVDVVVAAVSLCAVVLQGGYLCYQDRDCSCFPGRVAAETLPRALDCTALSLTAAGPRQPQTPAEGCWCFPLAVP